MPRSKVISQQMRERSRAQILEAGRKLFARQGFFNCKAADIAREAGMSQGNLYWYFPSKDEVLKAILADGFARIEVVLAGASGHPGSGREKMAFLLQGYTAFLREFGDFSVIFISIMGHGGMPLLRELGFDTPQIGMGYHRHLQAILSQAQQEGLLPGENLEVLPVFFFSFFNGMMLTYANDWTRIPPEQIESAVWRMLGFREEA